MKQEDKKYEEWLTDICVQHFQNTANTKDRRI